MADLRALLSELGLLQVKTYIQSGNIIFRTTDSATQDWDSLIARAIEDKFGFNAAVMTFAAEDFQRMADANPYPEAVSAPKSLHFYFLRRPAEQADITGLDKLKAEDESYTLTDEVFYLHAPSGVGRSKLAAKAEKLLGVEATARNWRTVEKLLSLL